MCERSAKAAGPRAPLGLLVGALWLVLPAAAAQQPFAGAPRSPTASAEPPAAPRGAAAGADSEQGVVRFDGIRIDLARRRIEIDAWFVVTSPAVALEYLATRPEGKMHETLLAFECEADKLMLGLILLGLEPVPDVPFRGAPQPLAGPRLAIEVLWQDEDGTPRRARAEDLLFDRFHGRAMERVGFAFTGSRFVAAGPAPGSEDRAPPALAAALSGSLIALYHDADAILDHPLVLGGDVPLIVPTFAVPEIVTWVAGDERYVAHPGRVPPRGTRATVVLQPLEQLPHEGG
ncbi:MAG: hypothetical protein KatS3mg102_0807 [Planctomycetota bacterium]|nr:MAG: hypothetical protein KatS3mg102_0807 [Planctomycetota bacterium]